MKINNKTIFFLFALISFLIILFPNGLSGQVIHSSQRYNYVINKEVQEKHMTFLTSYQTGGRSVASKGNLDCRNYICAEFEKYGLLPLSAKGYVQEFHLPKYSGKGGNVIGYIPAKSKRAKYIVVGAHFDNIGLIGEKLYPGADDNASGVTALLQIAQAYGKKFSECGGGKFNIVFVAFDANNMSMLGSRTFVQKSGIAPSEIECMINLDQMGSNLVPPGKNKEYLLVLGANKLGNWNRSALEFANTTFGLNLDIDYTYYNSQQFYNIFYRLSDQQSFTEIGVPALLFTSGITDHTNKETDDLSNVSLEVLDKRIRLIYQFLWLIMQ